MRPPLAALLSAAGVAAILASSGTARGARQAQPAQNGVLPAVSPDGRHIAFVSDRSGATELWVVGEDGSGLRRLTTSGGVSGPEWLSADRISFTVARGDTSIVMSVGLAGGTASEVVRLRGRAPVLAEAGSRVLFGAGPWREMQLVTASVGANGTLRADDVRRITSDGAAYWCHAVSPDGRSISAGRVEPAGGMQIWVGGVDGSPGRAVTSFDRLEGRPQCPAWSPDGLRLAFQAAAPAPDDSTKRIGHIWVVELATGRTQKLDGHTAPYLDENPAWFPDGGRIAFQSDRTGRWEVWVMRADGTQPRQLTR